MSTQAVIKAIVPRDISPAKYIARELTGLTGESVSYRQGRRIAQGRVPQRFQVAVTTILELALSVAERRLERAKDDLRSIRAERMVGRAKVRRMVADRARAQKAHRSAAQTELTFVKDE